MLTEGNKFVYIQRTPQQQKAKRPIRTTRLTYSSHSIGALHVVAEYHVLAQGDHGRGVDDVLDVHAGGVDLIDVSVRLR